MGVFNRKPDISQYNLVHKNNQIPQRYDLSHKEIVIELKFGPEGDLCIIGKKDNAVCWCSLTKLNDWEKNKEIFHFITHHHFEVFSAPYLILGYEKAGELSEWYSCELTRSTQKGKAWHTPFSYDYGEVEDKKAHSEFFARDIQLFYQELMAKCRFRTAGGFYIDVLRGYLDILLKETDYQQIKPLMAILEQESYLKLSPNKEIREVYVECIEKGQDLYNRYMDKTR